MRRRRWLAGPATTGVIAASVLLWNRWVDAIDLVTTGAADSRLQFNINSVNRSILNVGTLTVVDPGAAYEQSAILQINGPGTATFNPDGSFGVESAGPNLYWTLADNLPDTPAGVPTLSYTTGYLAFAVDASGKTTSYVPPGTTTDVCEQLG